jgi:hypothetical protein
MIRLVLAILTLSTSLSYAQQPVTSHDIDLHLSAEDQKNFREVCAMAMRNMAIGTDMTYQISGWCIAMNGKMIQALQMLPKAEEPK